MAYGAISGAQLNIQKTKGLFEGKDRKRQDKPLHFKWSTTGRKYLGIFLGNSNEWEEQKWTG
jgi:hypothetical protein